MRTDWLDLPKLTKLRSGNWTFYYPRHIILESNSHPLWMTNRHAQSHPCVSSRCIRLQGWRHNPRKYSLHPSLTNRHWGSSTLLQVITERLVTLLFVPYIPFIIVWESIVSVQTLHSHIDHSCRIYNQCMQNCWNSRSSTFSKTIWNRCISHSIITCIPFCHNRRRLVFSPFIMISVSVLVWITCQMAFVRDCGYNPVRWVSWVRPFCHRSSLICCYTLFKHCVFHFVANQWFILSGTKQVWWIDSDRYGKELFVLFSLFVSCYGVRSGCLWQLNFFYDEIDSLWYVAIPETIW